MRRWKAAWEALIRAVFPRRCAYCGRVIGKEERACAVCLPKLPLMDPPFCRLCGVTRALCSCHNRHRAFECAVPAMRYEGVARHAVLRLKDNDDTDAVNTMAQEMLDALRTRDVTSAFDVVTFVPMDRRSQRIRGFNQSERLARAVAERLQIPCRPLLCKLFETPSQKSLSRVERSGNLLGAFDLVQPHSLVGGERVLLVDDVFTTGATLHECAKVLKIYGAAQVTALTFAAATQNSEQPQDSEQPKDSGQQTVDSGQ